MINNRPEFRHTSIGVKCHPKAVCSLKNGVPSCVCVGGLIGDGYKVCTSSKTKSIIFYSPFKRS